MSNKEHLQKNNTNLAEILGVISGLPTVPILKFEEGVKTINISGNFSVGISFEPKFYHLTTAKANPMSQSPFAYSTTINGIIISEKTVHESIMAYEKSSSLRGFNKVVSPAVTAYAFYTAMG